MYVTKIVRQALPQKLCSRKASGICVTMHKTLLSQEGSETSGYYGSIFVNPWLGQSTKLEFVNAFVVKIF